MGNEIYLYDGSNWIRYTFSELSISVPATTDTNYDVFLYDNAGTLTLELLAWTNDTTRATAIVFQNGFYVKSGDTSRLYLGSFRTTAVSGQTEMNFAKSLYVWNYFNRIWFDATTNYSNPHTYTTTSWRAFDNNTTLGETRLSFIVGLVEDEIFVSGAVKFSDATGSKGGRFSAAVNTSTSFSIPPIILNAFGASTTYVLPISPSMLRTPLVVGYNYVQWVEFGKATSFSFDQVYPTMGVLM
jgi:hypothetical protein